MKRNHRTVEQIFRATLPQAKPDFEQALRERLLAEYRKSQNGKGAFMDVSHPLMRRSSRNQPVISLALAAALLMIIGVFFLLNGRQQTPSTVAQITPTEPFPLPELQPITSETIGGLRQLAQLGNGRIEKLAWSPDGETLAVAGSLGIWLYDADDLDSGGRLLMTDSTAFDVTYSPDGAFLASGHADGSVRLWDAVTGDEVHSFSGNTETVYAVAFNSDGMLLASGAGSTDADPQRQSLALVWEVSSGERVATLEGHTIAVRSVEFSPDGAQLMTQGADNHVRFWDVATWQLLHVVEHPNTVDNFIASHSFVDWERERIGFPDRAAFFWVDIANDAADTEPEPIPLAGNATEYPGAVTSTAYRRDDNLLVVGSFNVGLALYDFSASVPIEPRRLGELSMVTSVALSPNGQTLAAISGNNALHLFDTATWEEAALLQDHLGAVRSMALTSNADTLYAAVAGGPIRVWDLTAGEEQTPLRTGDVSTVLLSPDGQTFVYAGTRLMSGDAGWGGIWVRDFSSGLELGFPSSLSSIWGMMFNPAGDTLASVSSSGNIQLVDIDTRQLIRTLNSPASGIEDIVAAAFHPDGTKMVAGTDRGFALIYDVATGIEEESIYTPMPGERIGWVGYSADGRYFYTGALLFTGEDVNSYLRGSALQLWDAETLEQLYYFDLTTATQDEAQALWDAAFNADGSLLAAVTSRNVWFWNVETGEQALQLEDIAVDKIRFSADGRLMITGGSDGIIRLWGVPQ